MVLSEGTETGRGSQAWGRARPRAVLVLVTGVDPSSEGGGAPASYVRAHGRAAMRAGWDPIVLCLGSSEDERDEPYGHVVRVATAVRSVRQVALRRLEGPLGRTLLELADRSSDPFLAHGFGAWGAPAVSAVEALRHRGRTAAAAITARTLVREEHESARRAAVGEPLPARLRLRAEDAWMVAAVERRERWAYRRADRVWANYSAVRNLVRDRHGSEIEVRVIPSGTETAFEPLPQPPDPAVGPWQGTPSGRLRVVSLGEHRAGAGLDVLIDAIEHLGEPPLPIAVTAHLLGGGPLLSAHQRRAAGLREGSPASISVPGPTADRLAALAGADLVVVPSLEEPFGPVALLEAQRLGLPVVASSVDGAPEEVINGETGILVPPGDASALAAAMATLAADPALRARLAAAGQARFEQRHGAESFSATLSAAYSDLLTCALETAR